MPLKPTVELFRAIGNPKIDNGRIITSINYTSKIKELIDSVRNNSEGQFEELLIDGREYDKNDELPVKGNQCEFRYIVPQTFFLTINDFLQKAPKLSKGELPDEFFIVDINCHNKKDNPPEKLKRIFNICNIIKMLASLAHYHDEKAESEHYKLVFIQPDGNLPSSPIVIATKVDEEILEYESPDTRILDDLTSETASSDPHYVPKIGVFGNSLSEHIKKNSSKLNDFSYLIKTWKKFFQLYQLNLSTYLSGFAFHKAKKEIAETEFEIAAQYSKVINDITGKLLSIPISFTAIVALIKINSLPLQILIVVGLLFTSIIVSGTVFNQSRQLKRIRHAKSVILKSFKGKREIYPPELQEDIVKMMDGLDKNETRLGKWLIFYQITSWVPFVVGIFVVIWNYCTKIPYILNSYQLFI